MKLIAIGGEPGTGKSTLIQLLLKALPKARPVQSGLVRGLAIDEQRLVVLGIYDDAPFPGTDRLSMAVQPHALTFLRSLMMHGYRDWSILFEGDRLFTYSFLSGAAGIMDVLCVVLSVSDTEQQRRFVQRGSNQPQRFLTGRKTKIANIQKAVKHEVWPNETIDDQLANMERLMKVTST